MIPTTVHPALLKKMQAENKPEYDLKKDPLHPRREVTQESDMLQWKQSPAYKIIMEFILNLNDSIRGKAIHDEEWNRNDIITRGVEILSRVQGILDKYPCQDRSLSRFGNIAFRSFYDEVDREADNLIFYLLTGESNSSNLNEDKIPPKWIVKELGWYFKESWGNRTRIDFGSGHELSFVVFLCALYHLKLVEKTHFEALVFIFYNEYMKVVRNVQSKYTLEPAGSRGVWGLDDYFFVIFILGSSQLIDHDIIKPSDIHNENLLQAQKDEYLYLGAIAYIKDVKKGPFREHSPLLSDISEVPIWSKINSGMLKMFEAEVMDKYVVIQHLCFGKIIPFRKTN